MGDDVAAQGRGEGGLSEPPVVAVYGGRFDPFHLAHLRVCEAAGAALPLDKLVVVPSGQPVHKEATAAWRDRLAMARAALDGMPGCEVAELEPPGRPSFFHATLGRLPAHAGAAIAIVGSDAFARITSWGRWRELVAAVNWAVIERRPPAAWLPAEDEARQLILAGQVATAAELATGRGRVWRWRLDVPALAAAELRGLIAAGDASWRRKVPPPVAAMIEARGLYAG